MIKCIFCWSIFLVMVVQSSVCAQKNCTVTHYTGENGLPQNSIKTIFADPEGFVWLGTEDGLVRFDGQRFYNFNRYNLGTSNNRVIFGRVASRNPQKPGLMAGSNGKAPFYAYFLGGEAVSIRHGRALLDTLYAKNHLKKLSPFQDGYPSFHIATGLPNFVNDSTILKRYLVTTGKRDDNFYICHKDQVTYYEGWKEKFSRKFSVDDLWNYFSIGEELFYYDKETNRATNFAGKAPVTSLVTGDILKDASYASGKKAVTLYWNNVSDQTFLCLGKNLYTLFKQQNGQLSTRLLIEDFDFGKEGIEVVYYHEPGKRVFLGSPTEGLFIISRQQFQTIRIKGEARDNVFYAQIPYSENAVLMPNGHVVGRDMATGRVTDQLLPVLNDINPNDKTFLIRDKNNTVWVTAGHMLFHLDQKAEKVLGKWAFKYFINRLHEDHSRKIWIAANGQGLYSIDRDDMNASPELFIADPFLDMTAIKSESENTLLVGTKKGIYRVRTDTRAKTLIKGTEALQVKSIYIDTDRRIWFTAMDQGVVLLDEQDRPVHFPLDKNRYLASPHYIMDDKNGYFWVPTNKGLFQMAVEDLKNYAGINTGGRSKGSKKTEQNAQPAELFYMYHAKREGFNTNEFNGGCDPCAARLDNGYISLSSLNGLVWFQPEKIEPYLPDGDIVLDRVEVDQKDLVFSNDKVLFEQQPENVRFHFSSPYFGNPYNLNLAYALVKEGLKPQPGDWVPINNRESDIRFSSLNSGDYTLLIRKIDGFGLDRYHDKRISLSVPLLWYETWWAMALFVLVLAGAVYIYNVLRLRKIIRENEKLEKVVGQRTKELHDAIISLEESRDEMSKKIHVLSRLLTSITHDIQSPLNFVSITSSSIMPLIREDNLDEAGNLGEMIADSSRRMSSMLRGLLNYMRVNVYGNRLHLENIKLRPLAEEKLSMFRNMMDLNKTAFVNNIAADAEVYCDVQMLSIIIHNLIDNASKYTKNGVIEIYTDIIEGNRMELVVANSGIGIPQHVVRMINAPAKEKTDESLEENKAGLGLVIVREIADIIGVSLYVTQTDRTRFHLGFR